MKKSVFMLFATALLINAHADTVYKSEKNGVTVYSNTPTKGAAKVELPPLSIMPSAKPATNPATPAQKPAGPQSEGQKAREAKRAEVLDEELAREQAELTKAEKELAEQESIRNGDEKNYQRYLDRVQQYKDAVTLHKKNIETIKKEQATTR